MRKTAASKEKDALERLHSQIQAELPSPAIPKRRGGLCLGGGIRELVQRHAPSQRHPVRDAISAPQRRSRCDQPPSRTRLRAGASTSSAPLESIHPLLASAGGGLDQSATTGKRRHCEYVGDGRLIGGRGFIFPGSHRSRGGCMPPRNRDGRHPSGQPTQEDLQGNGCRRHHLHGSTIWTAEYDPGSHGSCTSRPSHRHTPWPEHLTWVHHSSVRHAGPGARIQRIPDRKKPHSMAGPDSISIGDSLRGCRGASQNHPSCNWPDPKRRSL